MSVNRAHDDRRNDGEKNYRREKLPAHYTGMIQLNIGLLYAILGIVIALKLISTHTRLFFRHAEDSFRGIGHQSLELLEIGWRRNRAVPTGMNKLLLLVLIILAHYTSSD